MFQFPGLPPLELCIHSRVLAEASGFPHSEISGSKHTYCSPKHIAVCRVLHRLLMPRHPPYALINLTFVKQSLTYYSPIFLIWWVEILMSFSGQKMTTQFALSSFSKNKITRTIRSIWENDLSKLSKKSSSFLETFSWFTRKPRRFHAVVFL